MVCRLHSWAPSTTEHLEACLCKRSGKTMDFSPKVFLNKVSVTFAFSPLIFLPAAKVSHLSPKKAHCNSGQVVDHRAAKNVHQK